MTTSDGITSAECAGLDRTAAPPSVSWREQSRARVGSWLDRLAVHGMCRAFDATLMPAATELAVVRASAAPYLTAALQEAPRAFFASLDAGRAALDGRAGERRPLSGGYIQTHTIRSGYVPFHADPATPPCAANDSIPIEHWVHADPAPATVIALHGFTMGDPRRDAVALMAPEWFQTGLDVVLITLPFHGVRTPATARYSGELFASWHVGRLNEAVRQSINDVRRVRAWLAERSAAPVGVIGISLGGYVAALAAALVDDVAFVIPIAAPVRLGTFPSTLFAHSRYAHRTPPPFSADELDAAYRMHSPLTYPLALPRERALIVAGRGDCIVPPEHPLALWRHWDRPSIHWYGGSHVTPFRRGAVFTAGLRHVRTLIAGC